VDWLVLKEIIDAIDPIFPIIKRVKNEAITIFFFNFIFVISRSLKKYNPMSNIKGMK
jgi:hypothetical protein